MNERIKRLLVLRHGKSAWPLGVPDHERPLGSRGRHDAPIMGQKIRERYGPLDLVLMSPTLRSEQTWELVNEELEHTGAVRTDPRIYRAWGARLAEVVRGLPEEAGTAMVLGHEPGVSELVMALADDSTPDLRRRIAKKFPTCAAAVLTTSRRWDELRPGTAQLEAFGTPKKGWRTSQGRA